jgi:hypothetical protein
MIKKSGGAVWVIWPFKTVNMYEYEYNSWKIPHKCPLSLFGMH